MRATTSRREVCLADVPEGRLRREQRPAKAEMTAGGHTLRLERLLPAPRAAVYAALSDPAQLAQWWGPHGFTAPSVDFDPRLGGTFRIAMQPPQGEPFHLSGEFREVDPPARLAYTFCWDPPDPDDRETVVTLSLEGRGDGTEVLLTQGRFATAERRALHERGWSEGFERLEQLVGGPRGRRVAPSRPR